MENDELNPEGEQGSDPSTEEQTIDEGSEPVETPSEGQVPYSRFQEVITEKNEMKETMETLKQDMETLKQQQPEKEEEEPTTWKEMEERAVSKAVDKMRGDIKTASEADSVQERAIEASFNNLRKLGNDITPAVEKQVLEQMIKTGNEDVVGNYLQIKDQADKSVKSEQVKQAGFIPSSEKGADVERPAVSYESIQGKTPMDILREQETQK